MTGLEIGPLFQARSAQSLPFSVRPVRPGLDANYMSIFKKNIHTIEFDENVSQLEKILSFKVNMIMIKIYKLESLK